MVPRVPVATEPDGASRNVGGLGLPSPSSTQSRSLKEIEVAIPSLSAQYRKQFAYIRTDDVEAVLGKIFSSDLSGEWYSVAFADGRIEQVSIFDFLNTRESE
jgi:hypothetical protein